jgi:putative Mg2+ transporter-C (MgtC) family protein
MGHEDLVIIGRVAGALVIGALIGFERTFHGRPAGFRTHSLKGTSNNDDFVGSSAAVA